MSEFRYLNTDLDVWSDRDLRPLGEAFTAHSLYSLHSLEPTENRGSAVFGTNDEHPDPERSLLRMLPAIEALTGEAAAVWADASLREFNIGYLCGDRPRAFNQGLSNDVLRRMASVGATLRITLYPPEEPAPGAGRLRGTYQVPK